MEYWLSDGRYVGRLQDAPGVFSEGETLEELEENLRNAYRTRQVKEVTIEVPPAREKNGKNPIAVAFGKLGGRKGGLARAAKLTAEQRSEIARKAVMARWAKKRAK